MARANITAVITAEDRASAALHGMGASFGKLASSMAVGQLAAQGVTKAFDALVNAGKAAISGAANFEQTRIGLENMLGSADKARVLLKDISKFAAETPFEFPELAQATKQLIAFGFGAEDAFSTMKQLGDVSAAVGAPINDLAYLMGTLRTQGRAFTIDIRQFAQRGIPIYEYLAKVLKVNENQLAGLIETGKVGFPEVQKAFQLMTAQGGKFHGTMAKQSKSLSGLFSTLKDSLGQVGRQLVGISDQGDVVAGGVFDKLRQSTAGLIESLPKLVNGFGALKAAFMGGGVTSDGFVGFMEKVGTIARQVYDFLLPSLTALWNTVETQLMPTMKKFYEDVLVPIAPILGAALVGAVWLVVNALNVMIKVVSAVYDAWANLFTFFTQTLPQGIQTSFDWITNKLQYLKDNMWEVTGQIVGFFASLPFKITGYLIQSFVDFFKWLAGVNWGSVLSVIWRGFTLQFELIMASIEHLKHRMMSTDWGSVFISIGKSMANSLIGFIEGAINGALSGVPGTPKVKIQRFAGGTDFAQGGTAIVGERGAELVNLPRGSSVTPAHKVGSVGGNITLNVNVGMYAGTEMEKRQMAEALFDALKDVAGSRNMTVGQLMGV